MSSSPAQAPLSPSRSPSFSSAFSRSPCDTPATPPTASACPSHAPPTPPDSTSRIASNLASSPRPVASPNASSDSSLSATFSATSPEFHSRLLDTPIDIHCLAPELDSPAVLPDSAAHVEREAVSAYKPVNPGSPSPAPEAMSHKLRRDSLPPPFIPAAVRSQTERGEFEADAEAPSPDSRPPNVYINGLPPNFPEEDLLAMCRPFGPVISVRTFTRHVSDKPSGYGFVLFETLASAERCIESLRKWRNLHPSFSKQVHKIPGTTYATVPPSVAANSGPVDTFKAKMEQLGDGASTNLYMEGLPLSITEETLRALVTPYRIMSSRFFHTRLSSPPRIIAFVRLETRTAAEDIIERLHGRLVRGWNDAGCRISVRFADTAEQREMRRNERQGRDGEQSPARLTMARAALLNLKGTQYQASTPSPTLTDISLGALSSPSHANMFNQLGLGQLPAHIAPLSPTSPLPVPDAFVPSNIGRQTHGPLGSNMSALDALNSRAAHVPTQGLRLTQHMSGDGSDLLEDQSDMQYALMGMPGLRARIQNGYTPVEQLILQAHARQQRASAHASQGGLGDVLMHDVHGDAGAGARAGRDSLGRGGTRRLVDFLPQMSEDDFHATGPNQHSLPISQQSRQRNHTLAVQARTDVDTQGSHMRATTLPSQYVGIRNHPTNTNAPLYDSSISLGTNRSHNITVPTSKVAHTNNASIMNSKHGSYVPSSNSKSSMSRNLGNNTNSNTIPDTQTLFSSKNNINISSAASRLGSTIPTGSHSTSTSSKSTMSNSTAIACSRPSNMGIDDDDDSSSVISPALTYSARTPATLSPATPYSGFFTESGETFKGQFNNAVVGMGNMRLDGKTIEKQIHQSGEMGSE